MAYDSNGNFSLPGGSIVANGTNIEASQHNTPLTDIAANGLSKVLVRDGRAAMTGDLPMGGNKITGMLDGTADTDAATVGQAASVIGDFKNSVRDLGEKWLRRDGALYDTADYPDLAELLPALADGVSWSNVSSGISGTPKGSVITDDGFFVASSSGADTTIWKSTDGASYSLVATVEDFTAVSFAHQGNVYILSGIGADTVGKIATSSDATVWSTPVNAGVGNTVYATSYNGSIYVAVGNSGAIASSPDTVTWTSRTSGTTNGLRGIKYLNGNFVVTGLNGTLITSSNGTSYTLRTTGTTENLFAATWTGSLYVAVGTTGKIITSPDLATWTSRTSGTTQPLNDVTYSTSGLLAVGGSGVARISSDGTTWTTTVTGVSSSLATIAFNPDAQQEYYVIGGGSFLKGVRTLPTQFRVPDDDPTYGWIKALA